MDRRVQVVDQLRADVRTREHEAERAERNARIAIDGGEESLPGLWQLAVDGGSDCEDCLAEAVERRDTEGALAIGKKSKDFIARILTYALTNKEFSMTNAFIRASGHELTRYSQGMATLDTCITAAPMLGLLGTVTGMMRTFGALGGGDIGAAASTITGGVAEALIATMCGLFIAICCLLPYNYMNARIEEAKHEVADASNALEILVKKSETIPPFAR